MTRPISINCETCDEPVAVADAGRIPRFCSDKCRKASYGRDCIECGKRTNGSNGHDAAAERCAECAYDHSRKLTRDWIIASIHEWASLFGGPPTAVDWNQHMARSLGRQDLIDRYEATARPWPSVSVVQDNYGSWNEGIEEAGYEPCVLGQRRDPETWRAKLGAAQRKRQGTEERRRRIADLYLDGMPLAQIGEAMGGVNANTIAKHLSAMRSEGWDLPYRKPWLARQKTAA